MSPLSPYGAGLPDPAVVHARLMAFYGPICAQQATVAREVLDADLAAGAGDAEGGATPGVTIVRREYGRWPMWESIDWRVRFEQPSVAEYFEPVRKQREFDRIPIGAYPELSARIAATVGALNDAVEAQNADPAVSGAVRRRLMADQELADLLQGGTILGYSYAAQRGVSGITDSVFRTLHVSITSMGHALAALAAYPVPGFDDGVDLAAAVVRDGVLNEFALLLPPNLLGPSCKNGVGFPGPLLAADGNGHVALAPEFRDLIIGEKRRYRESLKASGLEGRRAGRGQAGQGCPMARHGKFTESGIDVLGHIFIDRLRQQTVVLKPEHRAPPPGLG